MQISVVQQDYLLSSIELNQKKIIETIKEYSKSDIILFPELSDTGYRLDTPLSEINNHDSYFNKQLIELSQELSTIIVIGLSELGANNSIYNSQYIFEPNKSSPNIYRKTHLFHGERVLFTPGSTPPKNIIIQGETFLPHICYDIRFPELVRMETEIASTLLVSAAWPQRRVAHWVSLLQARAIENQMFVCAANRCGVDDKVELAGNSLIISPEGELLAQAKSGEEVLSVELNLSEVETLRKSFPVLNDRRVSLSFSPNVF